MITDCTKFIPAAQDQSYHFETDMNPGDIPEKRITDAGDIVYMSQPDSGLFVFQKETASAGIRSGGLFAAIESILGNRDVRRFRIKLRQGHNSPACCLK